jgi:DMSO/TMAO reductase YedYZ molybdopterin-dependent catalytic subunit
MAKQSGSDIKKPGLLTFATASLFLAAPLVMILFLGWKLAGLSFAPFNVFDWITRILPGAVITFSIDSMVNAIRFLQLGSTASVAKTIEQLIGVIIFLIACIAAGTLTFTILRRWNKSIFIPGLVMGFVLFAVILLIDMDLNKISTRDGLWDLVVFLAWGASFGWVFDRMKLKGKTTEAEPVSVAQIDRRRFLIRLGSVSAAIVVTGAIVDLLAGKKQQTMPRVDRWSDNHTLPNAGAEVLPAPGTRPEFTPVDKHYRIDINATPPLVSEESWRLRISGLVEKPLELSLQEIKSYEPMHQFITLACISNPVGGDLTGTQRWSGVSLQQLIPDLKLKPGAAWLRIKSADGFYETVAVDLIKKDGRIMVAYSWDGVPLLPEHGFPLRIYIPGRYGMKQPKWIESIEAIDDWEAGYWVVRGWDREALMKTTSVIDTVAVKDVMTGPDGKKLIPAGGIAHAGDRGISKVEVSIDDGDWQEAELRTPLSDLTWVIWRFDVPFMEGEHNLAVRCFDGSGTPQIITDADTYPSGATGLDRRSFKP